MRPLVLQLLRFSGDILTGEDSRLSVFLSFSFQIIHRSLMGFGRPGMRMRYLPYIGIPTVLEFVFWFFFGRSRMRDERSLEQCGIPSLTARVLQLCDCDIYLSLPCSYSGSIKRR